MLRSSHRDISEYYVEMEKGANFDYPTQSSLRHRSRPTKTRSKTRRLKFTPSQYALLGVQSMRF